MVESDERHCNAQPVVLIHGMTSTATCTSSAVAYFQHRNKESRSARESRSPVKLAAAATHLTPRKPNSLCGFLLQGFPMPFPWLESERWWQVIERATRRKRCCGECRKYSDCLAYLSPEDRKWWISLLQITVL